MHKYCELESLNLTTVWGKIKLFLEILCNIAAFLKKIKRKLGIKGRL